MPLTSDEVASRFPIHWLVWNNKHEELKEALESNKFSKEDIERHDNRGRTPLLLAVTLGHIESVQVLIDANADVNCEKDGWTAVQEATATGNPALLSLVLSRRDYQRYVVQSSGIPELLNKLSLAPDFYVEMKWEFTSWVPLVSRMCPFDTYKVYKRGANVRVDTTLVGFENNRWQRGDRTYIFRGQGSSASLVELDHEAGTSGCEYFEVGGERGARGWPPPPPHVLEQRLAAPLAINYLDTDKISFERNKSGIWGWRQDKSESVNGYECKVFSANNVELVSKTRSEHLPRGERRAHAPRAPLAGLLALADGDDSAAATPASSPLLTPDRVSYNNVELVSKTRSEHLPRGERRAHAPRAPLAGLLALADGDDSAAATPASSPLLTPDRVSYNNVELVSKTRSEHLPRGERRAHAPRAPLAGLLALADGDDSAAATPASSPLLTPDRVSYNNVELVSKTRSEHLPRGERRAHAPRAPLAGLLALADGDDSAAATPASSPLLTPDRVSYNNVELVSKTRSEHLPRGERRAHAPRAPLAGLLALADGDDSAAATPASSPLLTPDRVSYNNVELVSKTRSEHLPRGERRAHAPRAPLAGLLALADGDDSAAATPASSPLLTPDREEPPKRSRSREDLRPAAPVTWEEYFSDEPLDKEIGRPRDIATKVQKFRATLWLCEDYPLELQEQIMPILDLMASISSPHFAKLKDFIQMQLPAGFPVKIEIPLFHVLNARITFGNIFATETPVPHVECIQEGERLSCVVDDQCFDVGRGYRDAAAPDERLSCDDDEGLLQYAIQQSLMDAGTHDDQVDVWEALRSARSTSPVPPRARTTPHLLLDNEDTHLQRAIEASLTNAPLDLRVPDADANVGADDADELDADLRAALAISAREQAALDQQLQDEQKALDEVLRLSLLEK